MTDSVSDQIRAMLDDLTRAERQLALGILENYPVSGLGSITRLADATGVSTPTVARMVQKLGFSGFPEFQNALREELEARISNPISKHERWSDIAPQEHILNRFADTVLRNIRQTLAQIDPARFDAVADLIADPERRIFIAGGRITHALAEYLELHLQVIRADVRQVASKTNAGPHALLDMGPGDVLVIYDVRRYETSAILMARIAAERGAEVVLITDQWHSPVQAHASHMFACRIEAPSGWDSTTAILLLTETLIAAVQERCWDSTKSRMATLEEIFDRTRVFRKFT